MISAIIDEANMNGAPDKKLPYPSDGDKLSKLDCANEDQNVLNFLFVDSLDN